jgi:hypothetical protein
LTGCVLLYVTLREKLHVDCGRVCGAWIQYCSGLLLGIEVDGYGCVADG